MPRVLVVSYPWLPAFTGGVKHVATLCRYLPEAGWDPIVLARDWSDGLADEDAALRLTWEETDDSPPLRAAEAIPVVRAPYAPRANRALRWHAALERRDAGEKAWSARRLARALLSATYPLYGTYPDAWRGWVGPATRAGLAAVRQYGIGAVVSVSAPDSAHLAGGAIARAADVPWVPVFGDLGTFYAGPEDGRTHFQRVEHRMLMRRWLRGASRAAAVSPAMAAHLRDALGLQAETVPVPFDPEERRMPPRRIAGAPLRVVHAGRVDPAGQGIALLFAGLDLLLTTTPAAATALRVELVGSGADEALRALLAGRPAGAAVELTPRVSPGRAVALQREADLLLVLDDTTPGARGATARYPAALFELLTARRPALALASPGGYVEQVMAETRAGELAASAEALADALRRGLAEVAGGAEIPFRGDEAAIARYGGPEQARRLGMLLDAASAQRFGSWQRG